jgi:hypothetical protein
MNEQVKSIGKTIVRSPVTDVLLSPFTFLSAATLLVVRRIGFRYLKINRRVLAKVGVMPIRNHYYEPLFDGRNLSRPLSDDRNLPGINLNAEEQVAILASFHYTEELNKIPENYVDELSFHFNNGSYIDADAEYWYNLIRFKKPKNIIEIGSGHSTKMAQLAIKQNEKEDAAYKCKHICIEPYEMPWLEKLGITIIRKKVEEMDIEFFKQLGPDDVLFIDSSHMIRPQGDVLFEFLEVLPVLNKGVIVHVHDIFTPKDYPKEWVLDEVIFWNEQYLLEAFLTSNNNWRILGGLNFLSHHYLKELKSKCPRASNSKGNGSFYMVKQS